MSQAKALLGQISPGTGKPYPTRLILEVMGLPKSTFYDNLRERRSAQPKAKRGPMTSISDEALVEEMREIIRASPFSGEGYRKVTARLSHKGIQVGENRVLRLMRAHSLLAPTRKKNIGVKRIHDGRITTDRPNECWGGDITEVMTEKDGKVYIFDFADHCTSEIIGVNVTTVANRFSAVDCLHRATKGQIGAVGKDVGRGIKLRLDHGTQFTSKRYVNEAHHLGFELSYSFVGQPECNGVIERWHRTLKEQLLWTKSWKDAGEVKKAVEKFVETYNEEWILGKLRYQSPKQYRESLAAKDAA